LQITRKHALMGLMASAAAAAGCGGGGGTFASVGAGAKSTSTAAGLMRIIKSRSALHFPKATPTGRVSTRSVDSSYTFVTDAANMYTNVYDASGTWQSQFDVAAGSAPNQPTFTVDTGTSSYAVTLCDVSTLPVNQWTTIGDFSMLADSQTGTMTVTYQNQTTSGTFDAATNVMSINFADGSQGQYNAADFSAATMSPSAVSRLSPQYIDLNIPGCAKLALLLAALIAAMIAALITFITCTSQGWTAWLCKIAFDKIFLGIGALIASTTAIFIAQCNVPPPTPTPAATPTPSPPPSPTATPSASPSPAASGSPSASPSPSAVPSMSSPPLPSPSIPESSPPYPSPQSASPS